MVTISHFEIIPTMKRSTIDTVNFGLKQIIDDEIWSVHRTKVDSPPKKHKFRKLPHQLKILGDPKGIVDLEQSKDEFILNRMKSLTNMFRKHDFLRKHSMN